MSDKENKAIINEDNLLHGFRSLTDAIIELARRVDDNYVEIEDMKRKLDILANQVLRDAQEKSN